MGDENKENQQGDDNKDNKGAENQNSGGDNGNQNRSAEESVPLYKFKKVNDKVKSMEEELENFRKAEAKRKEDELKNDKKFEELLTEKEKAIEERDNKIKVFTERERKAKIDSILLKEIRAAKPNDPTDVLVFIDQANLTISEDAETGKITVEGMDKELEALKSAKPYLFGGKATKKNDNKEDDENNKSNAGAEGEDDKNKKKISPMGGGSSINSIVEGLSSLRKK